jgi:DNA-binding beta-propeller fold protein YncE
MNPEERRQSVREHRGAIKPEAMAPEPKLCQGASRTSARTIRALLMIAIILTGLISAAAAGGALRGSGDRSRASASYRILTTITGPNIPGKVWVGDLGWVADRRFYFADISNGRVDAFSTQSLRFLGDTPGFSLPSGVTSVGQTIWVSNGDSTVKVIDPRTLRIVASISTHGQQRADELAWDPVDNIVMVGNSGDRPPFASFISPRTRKVVGRLTLDNATGLEQPIWDPRARLFFVTVPLAKHGEILGVSPTAHRIVRTYRLGCAPSGIALGPGQQAAAACDSAALIVDLARGRIVARFPTLGGGDQVGYDGALKRYYVTVASHTPASSIAVIDAVTHRTIASLKATSLTHSLGVDPVNHRVFVPGSTGVVVYAPSP